MAIDNFWHKLLHLKKKLNELFLAQKRVICIFMNPTKVCGWKIYAVAFLLPLITRPFCVHATMHWVVLFLQKLKLLSNKIYICMGEDSIIFRN